MAEAGRCGPVTSWEEVLLACLEDWRPRVERLALDIWNHPEAGLREIYAADRCVEVLSMEGFEVRKGVGSLSTAVVASWGKGKPVIAFLGEYDALPALSQKVCAVREPVLEGGAGHACGHNLLGAGSLAAALAVKRLLQSGGMSGTVRFFGCPAEEDAGGKAFMAREGVFDGLDAALSWHPWNSNEPWANRTNAVVLADFHFQGESAPGPADLIRWPMEGKSAREAATIMEAGLKYLQGHFPTGMSLYTSVRGGGESPFETAVEATLRAALSGPDGDDVLEGYRRIVECARGATLMTSTSFKVEFLSGMREFRPNTTLSRLMEEKLHQAGPPDFDDEDRFFAEELRATLPSQEAEVPGPLGTEILGAGDPCRIGAGFTDVGDVSLLVPTAQIVTACCPRGVLPHTWQATASFGSSIGLKGMSTASKVLALTAGELLVDERHLIQAREEFQAAVKGPYRSLLPDDQNL